MAHVADRRAGRPRHRGGVAAASAAVARFLANIVIWAVTRTREQGPILRTKGRRHLKLADNLTKG